MPSPTTSSKPPRAYFWILGLVCLALIVPLIGFAWTGLYSRYLQDDYCYAVALRGDDFFSVQWRSYVEYASYSGNRYSLTLLMAISERIGQFTVPLLPGLAIGLWIGGFFVLFRRLARRLRLQAGWVELLLLSIALVYLTLYQAPNRVQILYWRAAMFPYLAPLITQTWLAAWILGVADRASTRILGWLGLVLLALLAVGFSETGGAFQVGLLGMAWAVALIARIKKHPRGQAFLLPLSAALFGSLLGMLLLIVSPVNAMRIGIIYPEAQSISGVVTISVKSLVGYLQYWLYRLTLPTAFAGILFAALGMLYAVFRTPNPIRSRRLVLLLAAAQIIHIVLLLCVMSPSAYAESSSPGDRALLAARFTTVITTAFSGVLIGWWAAPRLRGKLFGLIFAPLTAVAALSAAVLLFLVPPTLTLEPAYPDMRAYLTVRPILAALLLGAGLLLGWLIIHLARSSTRGPAVLLGVVLLLAAAVHTGFAVDNIYDQIPAFRLRAQLWDVRDAQISQMAAEGQQEIEVRALDSLAGISELQGTPHHWINNCAEVYYGISALWAVEPILNPP